ncbi:tetratricopeptide repeat protein [Desulfovibrio ferrophilus]|uniref:Tetratricopeptide repeat domain protein n=1 Tax=Desulfovibrio ferrophilus TaxID=241368 RepID=A0A2Z6AXZ8_9BACT|nr:tetratricopeptide repeat protein [Desulfovibrio ferrophilus]BBD08127.1 tetratricopeptide repeat domain protein [Desulfovibrio ferrophilus]
MLRTISTIVIIAALTASTLPGCSSKAPKASDLTLMERYHSGMSLVGDDGNLSSEQEQARAHLSRGMHFAGQQRYELAFEQYTRATVLDPTLAEARYRRGLILMENGMHDQALAEFAAVSEQMPDFAPAHEAAGLVYFKSALYLESEQHLIRALSLNPNLVRAHVHIGVIRNYAKDYEGALKSFSSALMVAPNDGSIYNNIGMTQSMMGNDEDAVQAFNMALRMGAPSAKAYNNMGLALARLQRWDEALEAFRCGNGEAAAYNNIGYLYFLDGMYPQAIASFERAIELEPQYYVRASENLKRARLALSFADNAAPRSAPVRGTTSIPSLMAPASVSPGPLVPAGGAPGPELESAYPTPGAPAMKTPQPQSFDSESVKPVVPIDHNSGLTSSGLVSKAQAVVTTPIMPRSNGLMTTASVSHASLSGSGLPMAQTVAFSPVPSTMNRPPMASPVAHPIATGDTPEPTPSVDLSEYIPGPMPAKPVYTLHVSSWRTPEHALRHADNLKAQGQTPYILHVHLPEKGDWYRVTIGMYDSLATARESLESHRQENEFKGLRIVRSQRHLLPQG